MTLLIQKEDMEAVAAAEASRVLSESVEVGEDNCSACIHSIFVYIGQSTCHLH